MATAKNWQMGLCALLLAAHPAVAAEEIHENVSPEADFTVREITQQLFKAQPGERLDYAGRDLTYLDLSGLDFKQASLARTDLYGVDFTGSNLKGADISGARLDRAVLIRTNLSGANLRGTTIFRPTVYSDMHNSYADAPSFAGANLTGIRVQADLSGASFRGADLTNADFSPLEAKPGQGTLVTLAKNVLKSCDFSGAILHRADFTRSVLMFSSMVGADLRDAKLVEADLSKVDFSGANLTGADVTGADFDGANLTGVKGLETATGFDKAQNLDKAFR
ncbi:pentapeptide repeat-containing protein [uncultured Hyphomicrobium sp.]|uniref:pentapeptide repeat-containing protein n=1 Tax=uncultured Hyphomicrobium sp. TaxID=194373 RepID=UPI0025D3529B|nr:pentapeptide repeat-containing protein [uncultured Hyphomicrobium sp.]